MKKIFIIGLLMILTIIFVTSCSEKEEVPLPTPLPAVEDELPPPPTEEEPIKAQNVVEITSSGFNPKILTIKAGDTVTWINKDTAGHWPATDLHPVHMTYPGSSIKKCGTVEEKNIFDACRDLAQGESYSFTFGRVARWPYHDHSSVRFGGTIVVQS